MKTLTVIALTLALTAAAVTEGRSQNWQQQQWRQQQLEQMRQQNLIQQQMLWEMQNQTNQMRQPPPFQELPPQRQGPINSFIDGWQRGRGMR